MGEQNIETWALARAHQIVVHHGLSLVDAAQSLDRKRTSNQTYALRQAISECLIEAVQHGLRWPDSTGPMSDGNASQRALLAT